VYRARLRTEALTAELHGWAQQAADGVVERAQVRALSEQPDDDIEPDRAGFRFRSGQARRVR
jgi:acylphosphatase